MSKSGVGTGIEWCGGEEFDAQNVCVCVCVVVVVVFAIADMTCFAMSRSGGRSRSLPGHA